jgi:hypothetical protein
MRISRTFIGFIILLVVVFSACKKDENTEQQLTFTFNHMVDGVAVEFDEIKYSNAFGNNYSVSTLKYFVSNITLHTSDGTTIKFDDEHYVDARDNSTLTYTLPAKVPVGNYTSISFIYGIDSVKNKTGLFPNPPESLMEWPIAMGGGYHYMKLEGKFDSTGIIKNYQAHTGPTMGNANYFEVVLTDSPFNCSCENVNIAINMNINNWWVNPNMLDLNTMSGIMGNQQIQIKLKENGNDVFSSNRLK